MNESVSPHVLCVLSMTADKHRSLNIGTLSRLCYLIISMLYSKSTIQKSDISGAFCVNINLADKELNIQLPSIHVNKTMYILVLIVHFSTMQDLLQQHFSPVPVVSQSYHLLQPQMGNTLALENMGNKQGRRCPEAGKPYSINTDAHRPLLVPIIYTCIFITTAHKCSNITTSVNNGMSIALEDLLHFILTCIA